MRYTSAQLHAMSDEELLKVCEERGRKGNYSTNAKTAQAIWKRRKDVSLGFYSSGRNPHMWDGYGCDNR